MIGITPVNSSTKDFEQSLDNVIYHTQENLDRLGQQHRSSRPEQHVSFGSAAGPDPSRWVPLSFDRASPSPSPSSAAGRLSRSSLQASPGPSRRRDIDYDDDNNNNTNTNYKQQPNGSLQDRKLDLLMKKMKALEERGKRQDKESLQQQHALQTLAAQHEALQEASKQDRKQLLAHKEQVSVLKQRVELLMNQDEARGRQQQERLRDLVAQRVQSEVEVLRDQFHFAAAATTTVTAATTAVSESLIEGQQTNNTSNHRHDLTNNSNSNYRDREGSGGENRHLVRSLTTVEKEVLRLSQDMERLKSKQTFLERIYAEMKESVQQRESRLEESQRKSLSTFQSQCDQMLKSSQKTLQDLLGDATSGSGNSSAAAATVAALRESLERSIDKTGSVLAEFDDRIVSADNQLLSLANALTLLRNKDLQTESRLGDLEQQLPVFLAECEEIYRLKDSLADVQQASAAAVVASSRSREEAEASKQVQLQAQLGSLQSAQQQQTEQQTEALRLLRQETEESLSVLRESQKKVKTRLRDVVEQHQSLASMRVSVEQLLQELERQISLEAEREYERNTQWQRLDGRVALLESASESVQQQMTQAMSVLQQGITSLHILFLLLNILLIDFSR
jgi:hypothetical protein